MNRSSPIINSLKFAVNCFQRVGVIRELQLPHNVDVSQNLREGTHGMMPAKIESYNRNVS